MTCSYCLRRGHDRRKHKLGRLAKAGSRDLRKYGAAWAREERRRKRELGRCVGCGEDMRDDGHVRCPGCAADHNARMRRRNAARTRYHAALYMIRSLARGAANAEQALVRILAWADDALNDNVTITTTRETAMLKITKAAEPIEVKNLTVCLYAVPGVGKTSMGFTAEKPLLLDFDKGSYRARNRGDVVQVTSWADVTGITAADLAPYATLVVDTAGRALDCLAVSIIRDDPKMGRGGALTLQGYGALKSAFVGWMNLMHSFGKDVVLLCHLDEQRKGDELIERLDMQGGSKGEAYKSADLMGRIYLWNGERTLNFSPTDTAFGKNPAQLPPTPVPDYDREPEFLAGVISATKAALNKLSAQQTAVATTLAEWKARIDLAGTCADFDALVVDAKTASEAVRTNVKRLIVKAAKERGLAFNTKTGAFDLAAEKAA